MIYLISLTTALIFIYHDPRISYVIVITQDEYDILVITGVRGEAEDEC